MRHIFIWPHLSGHQIQVGAQDRPSVQVPIRPRVPMACRASILPWCQASVQVPIRWRVPMTSQAPILPWWQASVQVSIWGPENPSGLSEYECLRLRNVKWNEARMTELGLLVPLAPRKNTKIRKCVAMQDDVVKRVQPKSYKDLAAPVISKRHVLSILLMQKRRKLSATERVTSITTEIANTNP